MCSWLKARRACWKLDISTVGQNVPSRRIFWTTWATTTITSQCMPNQEWSKTVTERHVNIWPIPVNSKICRTFTWNMCRSLPKITSIYSHRTNQQNRKVQEYRRLLFLYHCDWLVVVIHKFIIVISLLANWYLTIVIHLSCFFSVRLLIPTD